LVASKEIGLKVNVETTKCVFCLGNTIQGKNHKIKIGNKSLERVGDSKYLGITLTKHNFICEEIESRLKSRNACYHSVKNKIIKGHRTVILPVIMYTCKTWTLSLREEHKLRVFEKRLLRKILA
jgi:hypothetical protein